MIRWMIVIATFAWPGMLTAALEPDTTFGDDGLVTKIAFGQTDEVIGSLAVDSQDRIVSGFSGVNGRGVARHLAGGDLDTSFGANGYVTVDYQVWDVAVQPDDRIVVVGGTTGPLLEQDWRLTRLLPDGSRDASFGDEGEIVLDWFGSGDEARSVALTSDGEVVVGGRALDPSAGTAFAIALFDAQGDLQAWRADKLAAGTADICNQVLIQPDDKIVCAGLVRNPASAVMAVVRYESDLDIDAGFGTGGLAAVTFPEGAAEANDAVLLTGGEILLGGFVDDAGDYALALAQLTSAGAVDTDFSADGRAMVHLAGADTESIRGLSLEGGRVVAAVYDDDAADFVVVGLTADGVLDPGFGTAGTVIVDFNGRFDRSLAVVGHQAGLLVGGGAQSAQRSAQSEVALLKLMPDGAFDSAFDGDGTRQDGFSGPVTSWTTDAVLREDGGIVTVGYVGPTLSSRDLVVTAFGADGGPDVSFGQQGGVTADFDNDKEEARAVARLPDGRLLVAVTVQPQGGTDDFGVARFLADGSLDTTFGDDGWAVLDLDGSIDTARDLIVQADGAILLAGEGTFPSHGSTRDFALARFLADGSVDTAFGNGGVARVSVDTFDEGAAVKLLADGDIVLGGTSGGDYTVIRFDPDGSLDAAFGTGGVATHDFLDEFDFLRDLIVVEDWNGQGERILAVGMARNGDNSPSDEDFAAVMLQTDGTPETDFGSGGQVVVDISGGQDQAASVARFGNHFVLAGRVGSPPDFGALALTVDGQPDATFFSGGETFLADIAGSNDEVLAALSDQQALILAGLSFFPEEQGGVQKIALMRLAVSQRIFSDRFESP